MDTATNDEGEKNVVVLCHDATQNVYNFKFIENFMGNRVISKMFILSSSAMSFKSNFDIIRL